MIVSAEADCNLELVFDAVASRSRAVTDSPVDAPALARIVASHLSRATMPTSRSAGHREGLRRRHSRCPQLPARLWWWRGRAATGCGLGALSGSGSFERRRCLSRTGNGNVNRPIRTWSFPKVTGGRRFLPRGSSLARRSGRPSSAWPDERPTRPNIRVRHEAVSVQQV